MKIIDLGTAASAYSRSARYRWRSSSRSSTRRGRKGTSKNIDLRDTIRVDGTWSSPPEWVKFTTRRAGS
jgi:hypothetical protein